MPWPPVTVGDPYVPTSTPILYDPMPPPPLADYPIQDHNAFRDRLGAAFASALWRYVDSAVAVQARTGGIPVLDAIDRLIGGTDAIPGCAGQAVAEELADFLHSGSRDLAAAWRRCLHMQAWRVVVAAAVADMHETHCDLGTAQMVGLAQMDGELTWGEALMYGGGSGPRGSVLARLAEYHLVSKCMHWYPLPRPRGYNAVPRLLQNLHELLSTQWAPFFHDYEAYVGGALADLEPDWRQAVATACDLRARDALRALKTSRRPSLRLRAFLAAVGV